MSRTQRLRLGDLLLQEKLVTPEQVEQVLAEQRTSGRKLGEALIHYGWITEAQIAKAVARQLRAPFIDLTHFPLRPELAQMLPEAQARRLHAIVLDDTPTGLMVGLADPTDINAFDEVGRLLKRNVDLAVVTETHLASALDRVYNSKQEIEGLARELTSELAGIATELGDLLGMDAISNEDAPVVRLLYSVFEQALRLRASDIHIEPQEKSLRIRFRIDGVLRVQTEADAKIAGAVALRLKLMSGLDISEKRLPQDGRFAVQLKDGTVDIRISTMPAQNGESVVMRLLSQSAGMLDLSRMNMPDEMRRALLVAIEKPSGMILVTGPTGSGKTTTLYAAISESNTGRDKIITIEDPVEYQLQGVVQIPVNEKKGLTFARGLRSILRHDPDRVMVGEIRDTETAQIAVQAALTGHLVFSTVHANNAFDVIGRFTHMGLDLYDVASALNGVVAQRLMRLNCTHCVQRMPLNAATDDAELLHELQAAACQQPLHYMQGVGCRHCRGTGYKGRHAVAELLLMDDELRDLIVTRAPITRLKAEAQRRGLRALRQVAIDMVLQGRSSMEELNRVSLAP